jgi:hypothetical protein
LQLSTALELDAEITARYQLQVLATTSDGQQAAETSVEVRVLDRNDNPPALPPAIQASPLLETASVGTLVTVVQVPSLSYKIQIN